MIKLNEKEILNVRRSVLKSFNKESEENVAASLKTRKKNPKKSAVLLDELLKKESGLYKLSRKGGYKKVKIIARKWSQPSTPPLINSNVFEEYLDLFEEFIKACQNPYFMRGGEMIVICQDDRVMPAVPRTFHGGMDLGSRFSLNNGKDIYSECGRPFRAVYKGGVIRYEGSGDLYSGIEQKAATTKGDYLLITEIKYGHVLSNKKICKSKYTSYKGGEIGTLANHCYDWGFTGHSAKISNVVIKQRCNHRLNLLNPEKNKYPDPNTKGYHIHLTLHDEYLDELRGFLSAIYYEEVFKRKSLLDIIKEKRLNESYPNESLFEPFKDFPNKEILDIIKEFRYINNLFMDKIFLDHALYEWNLVSNE